MNLYLRPLSNAALESNFICCGNFMLLLISQSLITLFQDKSFQSVVIMFKVCLCSY